VSLNGRNGSREAKTDDDDIKSLPHQDLASARHGLRVCRPVGRTDSRLQFKGQRASQGRRLHEDNMLYVNPF